MAVTPNTIPISNFVSVIPGVVTAGGTGVAMVELMLTTNTRVPIGLVLSFPSLATVQAYFGAGTNEALSAAVYFAGFDNSSIKPGALLFTQYPIGNVGAYLRGGNISALPLAQLQALSGVMTVTIDNLPYTSSSINLSGATSFSNAGQAINAAFGITATTAATFTASIGATFTGTASGTTLTVSGVIGVIHIGATITGFLGVIGTVTIVSQISGTTGGAGIYVTSLATTATAATIAAASNQLDVTAITSGTLAVGQTLSLGGNPFISALGTGVGGTGVYTISNAVQVASALFTSIAVPIFSYDSVAGAFVMTSATTGAASTISYCGGAIATGLGLTLATGAVLSQGAIAAVPGTFMAAILTQTTNFATFQTLFDPDSISGNAQKQLFAAWVNTTNYRYAYLATDSDLTPTAFVPATASLGYLLQQSGSSGTVPIYEPRGVSLRLAAFVGGAIASINFNQTNGRATLAYRTQSGLSASVTNQAVAANLVGNGYNYYGAVPATPPNVFYPGSISGPFAWIDSYINQIQLNAQLQSALFTVLTAYNSIPYNPQGYSYVRAAVSGVAQAGLNFGSIRPNVPLSTAQVAQVNALAGFAVDGVLSTVGWYLVIQPASAQVRAARGSPTIIFLYMDGGSIQQINLSSYLVQ